MWSQTSETGEHTMNCWKALLVALGEGHLHSGHDALGFWHVPQGVEG